MKYVYEFCPRSDYFILRFHRVVAMTAVLIGCFLVPMAWSENLNDDRQLEIIPLHHRPAHLLIPELTPFINRQTQLSTSGNKLIIRGAPGEIAQLKVLIDELDKPLTQFLITVKTGTSESQSGGIKTYRLDSDRVSIGQKIPTTTSKVVIRRRSGINSEGGSHQLRATEGLPAYIETGQKIPVSSLTFNYPSHYPIENQHYEPVVSGFYVTPQSLFGDDVVLRLSTKKNAQIVNNKIKTQEYGGTVRAKLNEWVLIGGIADTENRSSSAIGTRYKSDLNKRGNIYLKVEKLAY